MQQQTLPVREFSLGEPYPFLKYRDIENTIIGLSLLGSILLTMLVWVAMVQLYVGYKRGWMTLSRFMYNNFYIFPGAIFVSWFGDVFLHVCLHMANPVYLELGTVFLIGMLYLWLHWRTVARMDLMGDILQVDSSSDMKRAASIITHGSRALFAVFYFRYALTLNVYWVPTVFLLFCCKMLFNITFIMMLLGRVYGKKTLKMYEGEVYKMLCEYRDKNQRR